MRNGQRAIQGWSDNEGAHLDGTLGQISVADWCSFESAFRLDSQENSCGVEVLEAFPVGRSQRLGMLRRDEAVAWCVHRELNSGSQCCRARRNATA
ncbi:hypothetical protein NDU88_009102 [Pleurodeles waltl]|uniref:Uncharacterized protein n=1 Tax=Pleurodeles waltl TaxID=8319 RepID=A0AAV7PSC2_PLEWA|nr:hypothetical protein NDU88_009102 [Pleurodeles waltl]